MPSAEKISIDDYVEGYENYNGAKYLVKGWVDKITQSEQGTVYWIQADDMYSGARGTMINSWLGTVTKLDPEPRPVRL